MSGKKKALWVFLFLFIYVVVALLGFFIVYLIKSQATKPVVTTPIAKTTPMPAPTGFKSYQNEKQKIAVSYPTQMQVKESAYGMGVSTVEMRSPENTNKQNAPDIQILTVPKAMAQAIGQDFESYYGMDANTSKIISSPLKGNASEKFTKVKNRVINGLRAVEYASVPEPNPDNQEAEIGVFIETGDEMTIIATGENQRTDLETMLTTFTYPATK